MKPILLILTLLSALTLLGAPVSVGSYNLRNYLSGDRMVDGIWRQNYPKPESEKLAVLEVIKAADLDVLVVQEIGVESYFEEFKKRLQMVGVELPYAAHMKTEGAQRCLAVFSKIPFEVLKHDDLSFMYEGETRKVLRGMLEVRFGGDTPWRLYGVHLKSRHTSNAKDPLSEEYRVKEATVLRDIIDEAVDAGELEHYIIAGDFNDTFRSRALRRFLKKGKQVLSVRTNLRDSRGEVWTQQWGAEGVYSAFDHLLISPAMNEFVLPGSLRIVDIDAATIGSDHRLVRLSFDFEKEAHNAN